MALLSDPRVQLGHIVGLVGLACIWQLSAAHCSLQDEAASHHEMSLGQCFFLEGRL